MPGEYEQLYAWAHTAFGEKPFTIADFRATFPSPAPAKVLSDLRNLGYLESARRGIYCLVPPEERLRRMTEREEDPISVPGQFGRSYAYCEGTAVTIWTDGGYWTGFTPGFRPLHLMVHQDELQMWQEFFTKARVRSTVASARETLFGIVYVLYPVPRVRFEKHGGVKVIPITDTYAYAAARPYLYEPVLSVLRRLMEGKVR